MRDASCVDESQGVGMANGDVALSGVVSGLPFEPRVVPQYFYFFLESAVWSMMMLVGEEVVACHPYSVSHGSYLAPHQHLEDAFSYRAEATRLCSP
jgi:hypothetical protein